MDYNSERDPILEYKMSVGVQRARGPCWELHVELGRPSHWELGGEHGEHPKSHPN